MVNALVLVCNENSKVTEGLANLHQVLKKNWRSGMSTDNSPTAILLKQTFGIRMASHKIKQINAPLRFTKVVFVCLKLLMSVLHLKGKAHLHLQTKLHNYQSKQVIDIYLNARS